MNVWAVCGFAVCAVCTVTVLKQISSPANGVISAVTGVIIISYIAVKAIPIFEFVTELSQKNGISDYATVSVKCFGISLLCQTASDICRDMGDSSLPSKIELAGKTAIVIITLPILKNIMAFAESIL